jgi:hypothetical protein
VSGKERIFILFVLFLLIGTLVAIPTIPSIRGYESTSFANPSSQKKDGGTRNIQNN